MKLFVLAALAACFVSGCASPESAKVPDSGIEKFDVMEVPRNRV